MKIRWAIQLYIRIFRFGGKLLDFGHTMKGDDAVGHLSIANIHQSVDFKGEMKLLS